MTADKRAEAAEVEALAEELAEHAPRTQPPMGLVTGCSCGWRIGRTMYEGYADHVAAVLAPEFARRLAEARAEALWGAADEAWRRSAEARSDSLGKGLGSWRTVTSWLRARAAAEQAQP